MRPAYGALCLALGVPALLAEGPAPQPASGEAVQTRLVERLEALESSLTPEQRAFVEAFRAFQAARAREEEVLPPTAGQPIASPVPLHTVVAQRNADGSFSFACVQHPGELLEFIAAGKADAEPGPAKPAPRAEEE